MMRVREFEIREPNRERLQTLFESYDAVPLNFTQGGTISRDSVQPFENCTIPKDVIDNQRGGNVDAEAWKRRSANAQEAFWSSTPCAPSGVTSGAATFARGARSKTRSTRGSAKSARRRSRTSRFASAQEARTSSPTGSTARQGCSHRTAHRRAVHLRETSSRPGRDVSLRCPR